MHRGWRHAQGGQFLPHRSSPTSCRCCCLWPSRRHQSSNNNGGYHPPPPPPPPPGVPPGYTYPQQPPPPYQQQHTAEYSHALNQQPQQPPYYQQHQPPQYQQQQPQYSYPTPDQYYQQASPPSSDPGGRDSGEQQANLKNSFWLRSMLRLLVLVNCMVITTYLVDLVFLYFPGFFFRLLTLSMGLQPWDNKPMLDALDKEQIVLLKARSDRGMSSEDPFKDTVVLVVQSNPSVGTMGIVLNRADHHLGSATDHPEWFGAGNSNRQLYGQLLKDNAIMWGGPVLVHSKNATERSNSEVVDALEQLTDRLTGGKDSDNDDEEEAFLPHAGGGHLPSPLNVMHRCQNLKGTDMEVRPGLFLGADAKSLIDRIQRGDVDPTKDVLVYMGISSWAPYQLEMEMTRKSWDMLVVDNPKSLEKKKHHHDFLFDASRRLTTNSISKKDAQWKQLLESLDAVEGNGQTPVSLNTEADLTSEDDREEVNNSVKLVDAQAEKLASISSLLGQQADSILAAERQTVGYHKWLTRCVETRGLTSRAWLEQAEGRQCPDVSAISGFDTSDGKGTGWRSWFKKEK